MPLSPLRYEGITIYQTDWSIYALQVLKDGDGPFNLVVAPLTVNGDKKLYGSFLPIGNTDSPNVKGISMLLRDLQPVVVYDSEGKFAGVRRPNSKLQIEIDGTKIEIIDVIGSRAAAQLSTQRKHSSQSHQSPKASNSSRVPGQQHFKESYNNSFKDRNPKIQNPQKNPSEEHSSRRDDESETDSDDDDESRKFDTGFEYDEGEAKSFFPSPDREEITRPIEYTHIPSPKNNAPDKKDLQKADSRKSRNELNDLVERSSSVYEDEDKRTQPRNSSRVSQRHEEEKKNDDFDSGNELKFGTLTGGRQNNGGLVYPPYTNNGEREALK